MLGLAGLAWAGLRPLFMAIQALQNIDLLYLFIFELYLNTKHFLSNVTDSGLVVSALGSQARGPGFEYAAKKREFGRFFF